MTAHFDLLEQYREAQRKLRNGLGSLLFGAPYDGLTDEGRADVDRVLNFMTSDEM